MDKSLKTIIFFIILMIAYTNEANHKYQNFNNTFIPSFYPIVEIHISCKDLAKLDLTSQSDPMCVLFTNQNGQYSEQDRTEVIKNDANPNFSSMDDN